MTSAAANLKSRANANRAIRRSSRGAGTRGALAGTFIAFMLLAPCRGVAEEPSTTTAAVATEGAATATAPQPASVRLSWEAGAGKSYLVPALEIVGFDLLLNQFNRRYFDGDEYDTSLATVRRNLRRSWVVENDPFQINQLGHPYQGSMYHGFARSAGLSYWESLRR